MNAIGQRVHNTRGQMTVELVVALPVLIIVAVIAMNALEFFSLCASFDRAAHNAVRVQAVSPAYGQDASQSCALVEQSLQSRYAQEGHIDIEVRSSQIEGGLCEFMATARFHPTLFGLGLRSEVLGVQLPPLVHETRAVVDCYKPGVIA